MRWRWSLAVGMAFALFEAPVRSTDPVALFTPPGWFDAARRVRVDAGAPMLDVLPASDRDLAVFGVARLGVGPDRLVSWMREIEAFQRGPYVPAVGRFSSPPRLEDLDALVLGTQDLDDIRDCRPGDCGLKLSADEIQRLHQTILASGRGWRGAVQVEFRRILLDRVVAYLAGGSRSLVPFNDKEQPLHSDAEFDAILAHMCRAVLREPELLHYLRAYPHLEGEEVESFLSWSKEELGVGKPIISITHVAIAPGRTPGDPDVVVASKQVYATHYITGSLSVTGVTRPDASGGRYLLYARHSRVDLFDGAFGGITRRIIERRIRAEGPAVLEAIRHRLESGDPPARVARGR